MNVITFPLQNVLVVMSVRENTDVHKSLLRLKPVATVTVGDLDLLDKATVVRSTLGVHRKQLDESPFNNQVHTHLIVLHFLYLNMVVDQ